MVSSPGRKSPCNRKRLKKTCTRSPKCYWSPKARKTKCKTRPVSSSRRRSPGRKSPCPKRGKLRKNQFLCFACGRSRCPVKKNCDDIKAQRKKYRVKKGSYVMISGRCGKCDTRCYKFGKKEDITRLKKQKS